MAIRLTLMDRLLQDILCEITMGTLTNCIPTPHVCLCMSVTSVHWYLDKDTNHVRSVGPALVGDFMEKIH